MEIDEAEKQLLFFLKLGCLGRPNWLGKQTPEGEDM